MDLHFGERKARELGTILSCQHSKRVFAGFLSGKSQKTEVVKGELDPVFNQVQCSSHTLACVLTAGPSPLNRVANVHGNNLHQPSKRGMWPEMFWGEEGGICMHTRMHSYDTSICNRYTLEGGFRSGFPDVCIQWQSPAISPKCADLDWFFAYV